MEFNSHHFRVYFHSQYYTKKRMIERNREKQRQRETDIKYIFFYKNKKP